MNRQERKRQLLKLIGTEVCIVRRDSMVSESGVHHLGGENVKLLVVDKESEEWEPLTVLVTHTQFGKTERYWLNAKDVVLPNDKI